MEKILLFDIEKEAKEKLEEYQLYHNNLELSYRRNVRRVTNAKPKDVKIPTEWSIDKKFNPFYVLKRKKQIVRSISRKLLAGTYKPNEPFQKEIPKKGGGVRKISVYQIPDAAVSDRFYHNLLSKNKHRFSSLSYAYRNDRNIHFAIQDIANELASTPRIFVAEFDFSDFFGSISHEYLFKQLNKNSFLISELEIKVIKAFLAPFDKGIPLGTSISLFLANLACWNLDRNLEDEGLRFARYADDTIIWSKDYTKISRAFDVMSEFSKETGISLNYKKSDGINLLQKQGLKSEFYNSKEYIEFLGYKISCKKISIKDASIQKIKKQVSYLLYKNLIQPIRVNSFSARNIPKNNVDRDFITAIMQIRRYLYGNMTEVTLKKYINGTYKKLSFKGIMSFYPLVDDEQQMLKLDKWLISTILNVLSKRKALLVVNNSLFDINQFPFNLSKDELIEYCKVKIVFRKKGLMQIPSFTRIHKALRMGLTAEGIEKIMNPNLSIYYDF
ncbi:MAG: Retron-type reverse transcriptase [uncultured Sulfurovum sp.]|uniref:Retron-type reverse transcriptase n=1 Tax=uncultured Sulfurovum sp. TaxID=269237 RepID=A0A6S6SZ93_9BACT|nr:MAG: Retron-type reverse transcriptase [uncultured Sulfurovum sp.]